MAGELNELLKLVKNIEVERELEKIKCYEYYRGQYSVLRILNLDNIISNKKHLELMELLRKEHNRKSTLYIPPIFPLLDPIELNLEIVLKETYLERVKKLDFLYDKEFCSSNMYLELLNELRKIYNISIIEEVNIEGKFGNIENEKAEKLRIEKEIEDRKRKQIKLDFLNLLEEDSEPFFKKDSTNKLEEIKNENKEIFFEDKNIPETSTFENNSIEENKEILGVKESKLVFCPLLETEIETSGLCFDIAMVVDGLAHKSEAPKEIFKIKNYREICVGCKNHIE